MASFFSQYTTTLYDAAMEAVTQSIITNKNMSNRKKVPSLESFLYFTSGQYQSDMHVLHERV